MRSKKVSFANDCLSKKNLFRKERPLHDLSAKM